LPAGDALKRNDGDVCSADAILRRPPLSFQVGSPLVTSPATVLLATKMSRAPMKSTTNRADAGNCAIQALEETVESCSLLLHLIRATAAHACCD
jgi:hypothetical protein